MSIEEMELFEAECKLLCYKGNMSRSNLGSFYNNEQTNWMYQMWLSSKNRDGYKFVPVSFLKDINSVAVDEFHKWKIKEEQMPAICEYMQDLSFYIGVEK